MKIIYTIALCLFAQLVFAQGGIRGDLRRGSIHWYGKIAADYHFNELDTGPSAEFDIANTGFKRQDGFLSAKDMMGARLGITMQRILPFRLFFLVRNDIKVVRHSVALNYIATENGYLGSNYTQQQRFDFTEYALNARVAVGYSLPVAHKSGAVELATGVGFHVPISGESNGGALIHAETGYGTPYDDIIMYQQTGWGDQKTSSNGDALIAVNVMADVQLAYRFIQPSIFSNRSLRVGLDFTTSMAGNYRNSIEVTTVRANRVTGNKYRFRDQHLSLGIFVAVEI